MNAAHARAEADPTILRISLDTKAKVKIGPFSRGGRARGAGAVQAADHDMHAGAVLVPVGILEVASGQLNIGFGTSGDTSDLIADALEHWWTGRRGAHPGVRRLLIDLDNGPEVASARTQFMKRLVEFADRHDLTVELCYYPPYHSKYNRVERCWGVLENHWNGALLDTVAAAAGWAATMTWKGVRPLVRMLEGAYARGVRLTKAAFRPYAARLQRSATLPKWSVVIEPKPLVG